MSEESSTGSTNYRVAVVDSSRNRLNPIIELLESQNLSVSFFNSLIEDDDLKKITAHQAHIVILNLFVEGKSTLGKIKQIKAANKTCKVIVITSHNSINNIREAVKAGADDFIVEPIDAQMMLDRVKYQLQEREFFNPEELEENKAPTGESQGNGQEQSLQANFQLLYDCLRQLSEVSSHHEAIVNVLKSIGEAAGSTRVNLIEGDLATSKGLVAASSDDDNLEDLPIDLEKYPEVREVLLNSAIIYIKDITQNPLTKDIQDKVKSIKITSMLVVPVRHRGHALGALSIRLGGDAKASSLSDRQLKTYFLLALALGPKVAARKLLRKHKHLSEQQEAGASETAPREENTNAEAPVQEEISAPEGTSLEAENHDEKNDESLDDLLNDLEKSNEESSSDTTAETLEEQAEEGVQADSEAEAPSDDSSAEPSLEDLLNEVEKEAAETKD